jgi:hypothetical protein
MSLPAAVLGAIPAAAKPKPTPIVAADAELDARLTNSANTQRQVIRDFIATELLPIQAALEDPVQFDFAGRIGKLQRDPDDITWSAPAANILPNAEPARMDHKLGRFHQFSIRNAARIVSDYQNDPGHSWSFPANLAGAKKQYLELVALEAYYIRLQAAIAASRIASVPLAEALALYRKEGDLVVPLPRTHLVNRVPPFERKFDFYLGQNYVRIKPTMVHGLWSYSKAEFHRRFDTAALEAAGGPDFGNIVAVIAFLHWHMIIVGFDFLTAIMPTSATLKDALVTYLGLGHTVRIANGVATTAAAREAEFEGQIDNLAVLEQDGRLIVAPDDVVLMLSHILGFGLLFKKVAGRMEVNGPFINPPAALNYLAHHTSDTRHRTDPHHDKFSWILASAAVALAKLSSAPAYCAAAYAKVRTLGLPTELPAIPPQSKIGSDDHAAAATALKDNLTASEMDQFAEFVLRADATQWKSYRTHRANAASYARMRAYYDAATAP